MNRAAQVQHVAKTRTALGLFLPPASEGNVARWKINGHKATVRIWTVDEWAKLVEQPADAQYYACGVWCALRME